MNEGSAVARGLEVREVGAASDDAPATARIWPLAIEVPVHDGVRVSLSGAAELHGEVSVGPQEIP
jgi:hypothetical protein